MPVNSRYLNMNLTHPGFIAAYKSVERQYPMSTIRFQQRSIDIAWIEVPESIRLGGFERALVSTVVQVANLANGVTVEGYNMDDAIQGTEDEYPAVSTFLKEVLGVSLESDEYFFVDHLPETETEVKP